MTNISGKEMLMTERANKRY